MTWKALLFILGTQQNMAEEKEKKKALRDRGEDDHID